MTKNHEEFPQKDQWVTESSGGTWQTGNVLAEEAARTDRRDPQLGPELRAVGAGYRPESRPVRGRVRHLPGTGDDRPTKPEPSVGEAELDYYVLGHASKFLLPGAVRIASDEPGGAKMKDVAFRNPNGTMVLYTLNAGTTAQALRIVFHGKTVATMLPAGSVATFVWRP